MKTTLLILVGAFWLALPAMAQVPAMEPIPEPEVAPEAIEPAEAPEAAMEREVEVSVQVEEPRRKRKQFRTCDSWDVEMGFSNWFTGALDIPGQNNEPYALNNLQSLYFAIRRNYRTEFPGPFAADFGLSVSGQGFGFQDPTTRIFQTPDGVELVANGPADDTRLHSQLGVTHVNVYLVPMLDFGLKVGVGAYAGYRINAANTLLYMQEGELKHIYERGSYAMLPYRYGLRGQIGVRDAQLFVNYDLTELFYRGYGPANLRTFSIGLIL